LDYEIVVVDDGSTDHTLEVVKTFQDDRVRYLRFERHCGPSRARNVGIQTARGEWIAFLDSDDEWLPRKLELQMARLQGTQDLRVAAVYCVCDEHEGSTRRTVASSGVLHEGDVFDHLLRNRRPPTASAYIAKRSALLGVGGFDEGFPSSHDIDLWLRFSRAGNHFVAVNEPLVIKHNHVGPRISNDPVAPFRGFRQFDRRWGPVMKRRLGAEVYGRWKARRRKRIQQLQVARIQAEVAMGEVVSASRSILALCRFFPWSLGSVFQGLMLLTLGSFMVRVRVALGREVEVDLEREVSPSVDR
jgi:glycosyltransferase involved in cell wall biosynthesis